MINMAVPHLGQSGHRALALLLLCRRECKPLSPSTSPRIIALQTWESCSLLLTQSVRAQCPDVRPYELEKHNVADAHHPWPKRTSTKG